MAMNKATSGRKPDKKHTKPMPRVEPHKGSGAIPMGTGKEVALRPAPANLPAYLQQAQQSARGSENVEQADIVIPRLDLVQSTSDIVKREKPTFNDKARAGDIINTLTGELFREPVKLIDVLYVRQYLVWIDRDVGGGFRGAFATQEEADKVAAAQDKDASVVATPQHLCLMVRADGRVDEVAISMPRTKEKVNRKWNSLVRLTGGDRFARVYAFKTIAENNAKGDFYNFYVEAAGFPTEAQFKMAEKLYNEMTQGERKFTPDRGDFGQQGDEEGEGEGPASEI